MVLKLLYTIKSVFFWRIKYPFYRKNLDVIVRTCGMSEKRPEKYQAVEFEVPKFHPDGTPISKGEQKRMIKELKKQRDQAEKAAKVCIFLKSGMYSRGK